MAKTSSTRQWVQDHTSDYYVIQANKLGYRSRASFKIIEIQDKYKIFKPNSFAVDLGAAPGGWSELVIKYLGNKGKLIALDLLEMNPIAGVDFIQGDFSSDEVYEKLINLIGDQKIDNVISDMAPNLSGNKTSDQARSIYFLELALDFACNNLKKGGNFVAKIFQGQGSDQYIKLVRESFNKVVQFKPKSSRSKSREFYIVALNFRG